MRFIKRLIFVIFLLVIAFLVYRLINPKAAKELLYDLKSFSNTTIGTHFSTGTAIVVSWTELAVTGDVIQETWVLQETTGGDELLLNDTWVAQENFDAKASTTWTVPSKTTPPTPKTTSPIPKTTSSSSKWLSSQDIRDIKNLLQNFGN